ncbi:hypothetical protein TL18_05825 [Methanobrevibacter sp. YE315]|uniref:hypothetical protein n=1 Tax=Methanobrevibacter sp. YE315 TaxID=1609968 RepID=UPI000764D9DB|nr:hypothetical protein [Methanobrevibacter sp. YE315]AMD17579.1 hypothetical protein TL18_05825 [Methanobrevibacter sp. YE315]
MKKIYVFGLFLIIAISSIGIACAASEDIGGYTFNIPDGYNEVNSNESHQTVFTVVEKFFKNDKGDTLNITVDTCDAGARITSLDPGPNFDNKTLEGHAGIYTPKSPTTNSPVFKFVTDDGSQQITIAASDASCINKCLK